MRRTTAIFFLFAAVTLAVLWSVRALKPAPAAVKPADAVSPSTASASRGSAAPSTAAAAARGAVAAGIGTTPGTAASPTARPDPAGSSISPDTVRFLTRLKDPAARAQAVESLRRREEQSRARALERAAREGWTAAGPVDLANLVEIRNNTVYVRTTFNRDAAISTAANVLRQAPFGLDGAGLTVGVWDQGAVRPTHTEFGGRVVVKDGAANVNHSTHVGGTIGASGVSVSAKGMAPSVWIDSYNWDYDTTEVAQRAMTVSGEDDKVPLSNHSYGFQAGWSQGTWYGTWGDSEAEGFGQYDPYCVALDALSYGAPYYLHFKAAGNDRNDGAPVPGQTFSYYDSGWQQKIYNPLTDPPADGWDQGGYDTLAFDANAKNVITVGAVNDAVEGTNRSLAMATMSLFSSWGPTDDGRVKPDIVADGVSLYSTYSSSDSSYGYSSGTSMATPNAAGSAVLVAQYYRLLFENQYMRASTLKGLLIHTADDLGNAGPDYRFGWGLINCLAAAEHIRGAHDWTNSPRMLEAAITPETPSVEVPFTWDNIHPIRATLCWTDLPGTTQDGLDNRTPVLVHDLDLRIVTPSGAIALPYTLDPANPTADATPGTNRVDNVEQVFISAPEPGRYRIQIGLTGSLQTNEQWFSLLVAGSAAAPVIRHVPLLNTTNLVDGVQVEADVVSEIPLDTNGVELFWTDEGAGTNFVRTPMAAMGNDRFVATIPAEPLGATIRYYISAVATNGIRATEPASAPAELFTYAVVSPVALVVRAAPVNAGTVDPAYGITIYPSGVTVNASAPAMTPVTNRTRYTCTGWQGIGSVPSSGSTNQVTFRIDQYSVLTWTWDTAYELVQTSSPSAVLSTSDWWRANSPAQTVTAPDSATADTNRYRFCMWQVDGARMPSPTSEAANPAAGIVMSTSRTAVAVYLDESKDDDADTMPDWWELRYFGSTSAVPDSDGDGDGYTNRKEFEDGSNPRDPDSTPRGPSVAHTPLSSVQGFPAPWPLSATVTDNDAVRDVYLEWSRNTGAWQRVAMTMAGSDRYEASVPAPGVTGDRIRYQIVAYDRSGLLSINGPYTLDVRYALMAVTPVSYETVLLPADQTGTIGFNVRNSGHSNLIWTAAVEPLGFVDGAETGTNAWTQGGTNSAWHVSPVGAHSGSNTWYFGSDVSQTYPDSAKAWLEMPPVLVPTGAVFSFWQWLDTEPLKDATHAWDGGIVEISTNGGAGYRQIVPEGGYPYVIYGHSASAFTNDTPCFASHHEWEQVRFDLAAYAGTEARIRFTFGSDGYVVGTGWRLDDIQLAPYTGDSSWLTLSSTNGTASTQRGSGVTATLNTASLAPGETRSGFVRFAGNDPTRPTQRVALSLHNTSRRIEVLTPNNGTVSPSGAVLVAYGASPAFTLTADPLYRVGLAFTNGVSAAGPFDTNPAEFVWSNVTENGTLLVQFPARLATNGVPQAWLAEYGFTNGFDDAAMSDQDGDGMASWQEFVAGTIPTDSGSVFRFILCKPYGTDYVEDVQLDEGSGLPVSTQRLIRSAGTWLEWPGASNRWYRVYSLAGPWGAGQVIADGLTATSGVGRLVIPYDASSQRLYEVEVRLDP